MSKTSEWNVSRYLGARLRQLGVQHLFGVPGNHLGFFLEEIHQKNKPWTLEWIGEPTEVIAGYAADGYSRVKGLGAVAVTYSVGAFSLINAVGGGYVELVPVVVINGAPKLEAHMNYDAVGFLTSHMSPRRDSNLNAYRQVTAAAEQITNARRAPRQIDAALAAAISEKRPVYLEIFEDVFEGACEAPMGRIEPTPQRGSATRCCEAVNAVLRLLPKVGKTQIVLWGGIELIRYELQKEFLALSEATKLQFVTDLMGKSLASECHPNFVGVYNGKASNPRIRKFFEASPMRIGLGAWTTSKNLEGVKVWDINNTVLAMQRGVRVNQQYYPNVDLADFTTELQKQLLHNDHWEPYPFRELLLASLPLAPRSGERVAGGRVRGVAKLQQQAFLSLFTSEPQETSKPLTYDTFFAVINGFVNPEQCKTRKPSPYVMVSDAGFSLIGSQNILAREAGSFFSQTSWLAIGWSAGAVTGVKCGRPNKRPFVFIGEGSFQETCQALSTHARLGHDTVIWVLNNGEFYGIEQMLVEPAYYKPDASKLHYYNVLHPWKYDKLADVFGMTGVRVTTHAELADVLERIPKTKGPMIVQVVLPRESYPEPIKYKIDEVVKPCVPGVLSS